VTGGAVADADYVPTDWLSAELGVEASDPGDVRRGYFGDLTDAPQSRLREISVMLLQHLQNEDGRILLTTQLRHRTINKFQVYFSRVVGERCRGRGFSRVLCPCSANFRRRMLAHRVFASPSMR